MLGAGETTGTMRQRLLALVATGVVVVLAPGCSPFTREDRFEQALDAVDPAVIEISDRSSADGKAPPLVLGDIVDGADPDRIADELIGIRETYGSVRVRLSLPDGSEFAPYGTGGRSDEEFRSAVSLVLADGVLIDPTEYANLGARRGLEFDLRVADDADYQERFGRIADLADEYDVDRVRARVTSGSAGGLGVWLHGYAADRELAQEMFDILSSHVDWSPGAPHPFGATLVVSEGGEHARVTIGTFDLDRDIEDDMISLHAELNALVPTTTVVSNDNERILELTP